MARQLYDAYLNQFLSQINTNRNSVREGLSGTESPDQNFRDIEQGLIVINTTKAPVVSTVEYGYSSVPVDVTGSIGLLTQTTADESIYSPSIPIESTTKKYVFRSDIPLFSKEMIGTNIFIPSPQTASALPSVNIPSYTIEADTIQYTASVTNIINDTTAYVDRPYFIEILDGRGGYEGVRYIHQYDSIGLSGYTGSYTGSVVKQQTQNLKSYTKIVLSDLETVSGELYKVKAFTRGHNTGNTNDYEFLGESRVTENEMLKFEDENSVPINVVPAVVTQSFTDAGSGAPVPYAHTDFVVTASNQYYLNGLHISSDNLVSTSSNMFHKVFTTQSLNFVAGETYYAQFGIRGFVSGSNRTDLPVIEVYVSGSSFNTTSQRGRAGSESIMGKHLVSLFASRNFNNIRALFVPNQTGIGYLNFIIRSGIWHIGNIKIATSKARGFSSKTYSFLLPTKSAQQDDILDFKIQFFNPEEVPSDTILEMKNINFSGSAVYINSQRNLVPGSIFIGNVVGEGIEIAGVTGS